MHVIFLILLALGQVDEKPCEWERKQVVSVCRATGKKSGACKSAIDDLRLCQAEAGSNDPLEGL